MTALVVLLPLFRVLIVCTPTLAFDDIYSDLIHQIQRLDEKVNTLKVNHATEIQGLKARVSDLESKNKQLSKENVEILRQMEQTNASNIHVSDEMGKDPGDGPGDEVRRTRAP